MARSQDAADKSLRVLIVGDDRTLEDEFRIALSGVPDRHGVVHYAETYRAAIDAARRREPNFVLIEIDRAADEVAGLLRDLHELLPATPIAGAFKPDRLDRELESAALISLLRSEMRDFIRRPLSTTELRATLNRLMARPQAEGASTDGRVASFVSNKGGVGRSVLAVNVACRLALQHPDDVLLIDTSLQAGTCAFMLDVKPATSIVDAIRERDRLDRTLLRHLSLRHGSGLRLLAAPVDPLEASDVDDESIVRIVNMARRSFKYVIVDTFALLDSLLMTILDLTDVAFVVVQGTAPAVAAAARLLPMLEGLGLSAARQRLVLNYNYKPFLGDLRPADIAGRLQRSLDYVAPYEKRVLVSMNTGQPVILQAGRWQRFGRTIGQMADDVGSLAIAGSREAGAEPDLELRLRQTAGAAAADPVRRSR